MAVGTITPVSSTVWGNKRVTVNDVVGAASYTGSGGDSLTPAQLGLPSTVEFAQVVGKTGTGYIGQYDHTANKLKVYQGDNANAAAAPAVEVTNATNLSGQTFRVIAVGY